MRIQSPYSDYYDGVRKYGIDPNVFYHRVQVELSAPDTPITKVNPGPHLPPLAVSALSELPSYNFYPRSGNILTRLLGFCGRVYPIWSIVTYSPRSITDPNQYYDKNTLVTNYHDPLEFLKGLMTHQGLDEFRQHQEGARPSLMRTRAQIIQKVIDDFQTTLWRNHFCAYAVAEWNAKYSKADFTSDFVGIKAPVFLLEKHDGRWCPYGITNPHLKGLGFSRILDPESCYQELSMFIGNHLTGARPVPEVSDKDLITGKGFDKYSFRMDSPGKKKNRRNKPR